MTLVNANLLSTSDVGEASIEGMSNNHSLYGISLQGSSSFNSSLTSRQFIQKVFCYFEAENSSGILSSFPFWY